MKFKKISFFVFSSLLLFLGIVFPNKVLAKTSYIHGKVFLKLDGREYSIPGAVVIREDAGKQTNVDPSSPDACGGVSDLGHFCWGINRGAFSVSDPSGKYSFETDMAIGNPGCDIPDMYVACQGLQIGQNPSQATCDAGVYFYKFYLCGITCMKGKSNPQRWLAYFPPSFDKNTLPAGVYFQDGDMKGGGSWKAEANRVSCADNKCFRVKAGGKNWQVDAVNFGQVTYGPNEWYRSDTPYNASGFGNINIEWVPPPTPSFQCTGLGPQPTDPQPGEELSFTCTASVSNTTINHYNFRVNEGTVTRVETSNLEANFNYSVPQGGGDFKVQCQVCTSSDNSVCTTWGQVE